MLLPRLQKVSFRRVGAWLLLAALLAQSCVNVAPAPPRATPEPPATRESTRLPSSAPPGLQATDPQAGPAFRDVRLSATQTQRYARLELTFNLTTVASMPQFPYDPAPPAGVAPGLGVSVEAQFTPDGWRSVYRQPAFLYQEFQDEVRGAREWIYPTGAEYWKVRFSPPSVGDWQVKLVAQDAGGRSETAPLAFRVTPSNNRGFIRVSKKDARYFEYENGDYFPALGYNMNYDAISWTNPVLDNEENFRVMSENGIQLVRMWLSQWSIYGSAWNPWNSIDGDLHSQYIPYSGLSFSRSFPGEAGGPASETSMRLDASGNACMFLGFMKPAPAVKPNTRYRVRVRYRSEGLQGPRQPGAFGLVVKTGGWLDGAGQNCFDAGTGQALTPAPGGESTEWRILEGALATGSASFMPNLYLALENAAAGLAFVDYVWVEEDLGGGRYGPNILPKPWMSHHLYFDQRNSFAFDQVLALAEKYGVYLRPVLLEKNDWIFNRIDDAGQPILYDPQCDDDTPANDPAVCPGNRWFYGDGRRMTKTRWLQTAWWRYVQARWGYSTSIHSWELLNEGDPANAGHFILADELGRYMRQFYPNHHLVSTSFWHSFPRDAFWNNPAYPNVDFADIHRYVDDTSLVFRDTAELTLNLSLQIGAKQSGGAGKPVIRGETGLQRNAGDSASQLVGRDVDGIWLHNYVWAGINAGGLIEQYWWVEGHIYRHGPDGSLVFDHRPEYGTYYRFIQGLPLNNGAYQDAAATASHPRLRALGQKDLAHGRAHLWIQNVDHTWFNVINGVGATPVTGSVSMDGFRPNQRYFIEWWDPYAESPAGAITRSETLSADAAGVIRIGVQNLREDIALRLSPAGPVGDFFISIPLVVRN